MVHDSSVLNTKNEKLKFNERDDTDLMESFLKEVDSDYDSDQEAAVKLAESSKRRKEILRKYQQNSASIPLLQQANPVNAVTVVEVAAPPDMELHQKELVAIAVLPTS